MTGILVMDPKFPLGQLVWTRAVNERIANIAEFAAFVLVALQRHAHADWGDMDAEDKQSNDEALAAGDLRIFSSYKLPESLAAESPDKQVWVITEADHSVTTVLFPSDY